MYATSVGEVDAGAEELRAGLVERLVGDADGGEELLVSELLLVAAMELLAGEEAGGERGGQSEATEAPGAPEQGNGCEPDTAIGRAFSPWFLWDGPTRDCAPRWYKTGLRP